jgi:hypothetical protein
MGFRFQKRLSILPGVRINLSKSGVSTSLGPRGADVNIGRDGVTTNAGIPGTGLSYRQKLGGAGKGGLLGMLAVVGALGFWAFQHAQKIEKAVGSVTASPSQAVAPAATSPAGPALRYVHRDGSVLRDEPKTSSRTLKKESKGAEVKLVSEGDGWNQVTDGNITGYMRSSVLGVEPPR